VDVAAPGGDITVDRDSDGQPDGVLSTLAFDVANGRQAGFDYQQGTSMASPHVAGVAALMRAAFPGLTPAQFDTALATGAITRDLAGNGASVRDDQFGYGLIDAFKAVVEARRLGGTGTVPPALGANFSTLDFGSAQTQLTLVLSNLGQGSLTVTSVSGNRPWLSVQPAQVTNGLGSYTVRVDRAGLIPGTYQGQLAIAASTGNFSLPVSLRVGNVSAGSAGVLFVLLVDQITGRTVAQDVATSTSGNYAFGFTGIRPGNYYVYAGTDLDNDFIICDAGEICGALGTLTDPAVLRVSGSNITLSPFPSMPDEGGGGVSGQSTANQAAGRVPIQRRLR
jgi:serine protease